ncbi:two-component system sensor histidine kinase PhoR [Saccharobesus litoralis]|uniref:Phosphate regulon sensor protein PhoR n=1 Tax=Saccharobesus litoralis TaxID=2172099 RepID=A0A2S0VTY9_9ALTE|nr:phosphate regulon sensor histidine kinase PhoR [Saccharobesus litoralis]AWB67678.1 two-component system sensor histidine kinase PhoR [Saccharobesus litoralis]
MNQNAQHFKLVFSLGLVTGLSFVLSLYFDNFIFFMFLGVLGLLLAHHYNFVRLFNWLWHRKTLYPPQSKGSWGEIFDGIYKLQLKNRSRRKELGRFLKRFREGAEALPDGIVLMRNNGQIAWCNQLASHLLGIRWPDDNNIRIDNLVRHPDFIEAYTSKQFDEPIIIPSPIAHDLVIEIRIVPYTYDEYLLLARDVTQVSRLNQMRKDFIANVSHELKTPLTVIQGYLEMYRDYDMQIPINPKSINSMLEQSERMMSLISQLLVLSRIEANSESLFDQVIDVRKMLAVIESEATQLNTHKNHSIQFVIQPDLMIYGIEDEMRSAMTNLVKNAIHYTQPEGEITVSWSLTEQGNALFKVEDNGLGIAEHHLARLTERFYRVDKARARSSGGTGLGLSIVKHVLQHHHSELMIDSVENKGSSFSFEIPQDLVLLEQPLKQAN